MAFNPKILANLKPLRDPDRARELQKLAVEARARNTLEKEQLKITARQYKFIAEELPDLGPIEVLNILMVNALTNGNYEDAAKYANMIAPYKAPKLAVVEQKITSNVKDMSDEDLRKYIADKGISKLLRQIDEDEKPRPTYSINSGTTDTGSGDMSGDEDGDGDNPS